jgi:hypothetical protein
VDVIYTAIRVDMMAMYHTDGFCRCLMMTDEIVVLAQTTQTDSRTGAAHVATKTSKHGADEALEDKTTAEMDV